MRSINWIRFTWELTRLPRFETLLPEHYEIGPSQPEDEAELRKLICSSFILDPDWNSSTQEVLETIEVWLERAFQPATDAFLALRHGTRIIGAAALSLDPAAVSHLAPGPCILMEYRNRGFGSRLLEQALLKLRAAGLVQASGIAKANTPVAKFLYPKFDASPAPHDAPPASGGATQPFASGGYSGGA